jgi:hypothetical protein
MYLATAIFYVAIPALDFAFNAAVGPPINPQQLATRRAACAVIASALCGIYGNGWYRGHVARVVQMVRARNLPEEEHLRQLRARGGTRPMHALGAILLLAATAWGIDQAGM